MPGLLTETVVLRRLVASEEEDELGNPLPTEPVEEDSPAWVEPITSREAADRQIQQTYGYVVYLPTDVDLTGADQIVYEGVKYDVIGEPQQQPGGFIVDGYQRVLVERVTG